MGKEDLRKILKGIRRFDKKRFFKKYNLELRDIVYLLQLGNYIKYNCDIYTLSQKYDEKYNNSEFKKDTGDAYLKMKTGIEKKLGRMGYIINDSNPGLTKQGSEKIQEIYTKASRNIFKKFELCLEKHVWIAFVISIIGIRPIIHPYFIKVLNYLKSICSNILSVYQP